MERFDEDIIDGEENYSSALHANISSKGNNSYYYAHGNTANGPVWDGKEQPRLLSSGVAVQSDSVQGDCGPAIISSVPSKPVVSLKKVILLDYAWADEKSTVKVYIDFADAGLVNDDDLVMTHSQGGFVFTVEASDRNYKLNIPNLAFAITNASFKKKSSKFVITLKKEVVSKWVSLKTNRPGFL